MTTNKQRKWRVYHYACFSPADGTGMTGKISFQIAVSPELARVKVNNEIAESMSKPGIDFICDPNNMIIIVKPKINRKRK